MRAIRKFKQGLMVHNMMIAFAAMSLCIAAVSDAQAAGRGRGGHMRSRFGAPWQYNAPSMPSPTFNPSTPYTVPQSPETPVSPASPGSIFGNG
jgi:hypothetical protein